MKQILTVALVGSILGCVSTASAGTTNVYSENWGSGNSGVTGNGNIYTVGWTGIAVSQTAGPYLGIYNAGNPTDSGGAALPPNTVYFTVLTPTQTAPGMFYTTDTSGAGLGGNSSFVDILPTHYTNLTLTVEVTGAATDTNYFAVQVGGLWYVATSYQLPSSAGLGGGIFTNATLLYTNSSTVWQSLTGVTAGATNVSIGAVASFDLTAPITGIGIVELPTGGGFNYNQLAITAFTPNAAPPSPPTNTFATANQTVFTGGGATFLSAFTGTTPVSYQWQTNGINIPASARYIGLTNNTLTITNATLNDAGTIYSVIATNVAGSATSSVLNLFVVPTPSDMIYSEMLPYIGPSGNIPLTAVGWADANGAGSGGIFTIDTSIGQGAYFNYSPSAVTNVAYTTVTNDVGLSGLPFPNIAIASYPVLTFQAQFRPGNGAGATPGAVTVHWAVQVNSAWYSSVQAIPINLAATTYLTNQYAFHPDAVNWNTLTISGNTANLGGVASSPLAGTITGAGLVFVHNNTNGSSMNFENFEISTNPVSILAPAIGTVGAPYSQTVAAGGGVSFGVSATGTQPFTYGWTLNGVVLNDGGRFSGTHTPILTIANLTSNDSGQVIAYVTNSVGVDNSLTSPNSNPAGGVDTELVVTNPSVGLLYSETFPFIGPLPGNYPISSAGWVVAAPGNPNTLYERVGSDAANFAYLGSAGTTAYYATTTTDTNQAGLPFPNIGLAFYPDLTFSVDIAPQFSSSNVTAYIAVQLAGTNWYVAATPVPVPTSSDSTAFSTYTVPFSAAAADWKNLTITSSGALIGGPVAQDLKGIMTGAGLVFVTVGTGGTMNFDNFIITGSGLGGINLGTAAGGAVGLSWVGNPAVNLQSATSLMPTNWQDVANSAGAYSWQVPLVGPQKFFRLVQH